MPAKPSKQIAFLGIAMLVMSVILLFVYPPRAPWLPKGFTSPIIAFEFIRTPKEAAQLFGNSNSAEHALMINRMNRGNWLDFLYMVLYSSFLGLFALKCAQETNSSLYYGGVGLAGLMLVGDFLENLQLFGITAKFTSTDIGRKLAYLHLFTWLKWGSLALFFLVLFPYFLKGNRFAKIIGVCGLFPAITGIVAYMHRSVWNELLMYSIALMFMLLIIYGFLHHSQSQRSNVV